MTTIASVATITFRGQGMFSRLKWAVIFFLLALLTLPMCILNLAMRQDAVSDHLLRTPGNVTFEVREPGEFNIVFVRYEWVNNQYVNYPVDVPKGLAFKLTRMSDNSDVPIKRLPVSSPPQNTTSKNTPSNSTHTFARTHIDQKGYYQLHALGSQDTRLVKLTQFKLGSVFLPCFAYPCFFFLFLSLAGLFWSLALLSRQSKSQPNPYAEVFDNSEHF